MGHTDKTNPAMMENVYTKLVLQGAGQNGHEETVGTTDGNKAAKNGGYLTNRDRTTGNSQIQ